MNKKVYFIGSETLKEKLRKGIVLLGWDLENFIGWDVKDLIIYELNNIDNYKFHIPENLLIITNNISLKDTGNTHIFFYQNNELKFNFSKFLLSHLQKEIKPVTNFYDTREEVRILYLNHTKDLKELLKLLSTNKKYLFKVFKYSNYFADQPVRSLIYTDEKILKSCYNFELPTIYKGLNFVQKKELKRINPLVPKIFINNINKSALRKILKHLN